MPRFKDPLLAGTRTFEARQQVQWADVDIAGIMYFAAYWRFAEYAEQRMFEAIGFPYERVFEQFDMWMPRVHVEATYHASALMGDWMHMRAHVDRVGASSISYTVVMFNERTNDASAVLKLTIAAMNRKTKKSMPLPEPVRSALT